MEQTGTVTSRRPWGKRTLVSLAVVLGLPVAWHLYLSVGLNSRVRSLRSIGNQSREELWISVKPVTNLVSMTIALPPGVDDDNPFAALGSALGQAMIQAVGPSFIERELNTRAREQYDLYAQPR